jgi:hypothetical protein
MCVEPSTILFIANYFIMPTKKTPQNEIQETPVNNESPYSVGYTAAKSNDNTGTIIFFMIITLIISISSTWIMTHG